MALHLFQEPGSYLCEIKEIKHVFQFLREAGYREGMQKLGLSQIVKAEDIRKVIIFDSVFRQVNKPLKLIIFSRQFHSVAKDRLEYVQFRILHLRNEVRQLFRDLRARKETNVLDDGRVEGHISLADKQRLEAVDRENKEQTK